MWTRIFWIDAADRAARTFAQALLATITIGDAVYSVDWQAGLGIAVTAAIASILTSIATSKVGAAGTPAVVIPAAEATPTPVNAAPAATADTHTPAHHREVKEWPTN